MVEHPSPVDSFVTWAQAEDMAPARSTFGARLAAAKHWTPELREYAVSYVLKHTTRGSIYELLDAAGVPDRPGTMFKTDHAQLLVSHTTPRSLADAWQAWRTGKG